MTLSPIHDAHGEVSSISVMSRDIPEAPWTTEHAGRTSFAQGIRDHHLGRGEGVPGRVWETGRAVWVEGVERVAEPRMQAAAAAELRTAVGVPLLLAGEVVGVVEFLSGNLTARDPDMLTMGEAIVARLADALARHRAQEALRAANQALEARVLERTSDLEGVVAERERSVALLRDAVGEGRLTLEEFSERIGLAHAARTDKELANLVRDLPATTVAPELPAPVADEHRAFCSHLIRSGPWSVPRRSSWRSIFGTIDLDLRKARLAGPETVFAVYNLFGTVTVIVPEGLEVVVRGGGLFASQKIELSERPPIAGGPSLTIETRGPGGTLRVRARPTVKATMKQITRAIGH